MEILQKIKYSISTRDISTFVLAAVLLTVYYLPTEFLFHNPTSFCIHKNLLHFDCPGCGMTRALHSLLHGQFRQAIIFNIAIAPFTILIVQHFLSYILPSRPNDIFRKISLTLFTTILLSQYFIKSLNHFL
jgi:hypothetical protein|tara:strand:+ start:58 stop:450 length:393 start_codon:yes stop_codon:yes gene_type:complete